MAWDLAFIAGLKSRTSALRYLLRRVAVFYEPGDTFAMGSHSGLSVGQAKSKIVRVDVAGPTVTPRVWTSTIGQFNVVFAGDLSEVCAHITAGTVCELLAGFADTAPVDFQRIAIGQLRDITAGSGPEFTIEFFGIDAACRQRLHTGYGMHDLFAGANNASALSAAYTPGDTSIEVTTTLNFERETGMPGALKITPTTGDPFYLTYTGVATGPVRFTGLSAAGVCGTTAVAAAAADVVNEVAYLTGHPIDIARKMFASTGAGTNGTYDTYPSDWGVGLLDELLDHDDMGLQKTAAAVGSGSYDWAVIQGVAVDNAYAWLAALLSQAGLVITVRQGCLTVRAAQNSQTAAVHSGISITDQDIARVGGYEAFELRHRPEYTHMLVETSTTSSGTTPDAFGTESAATLPSSRTYLYGLHTVVFANDLAIVQEVHSRVQESVYRVPERISFLCAGLRLAQLANLDIVDLTTKQVQSRRDGPAGFAARRAVIENVSPIWGQGAVNVSLLVYPESSDAFA